MKRHYLFEKKYNSSEIYRKIFHTSEELFEYLQAEGERIFNDGGGDAEILLCRISEEAWETPYKIIDKYCKNGGENNDKSNKK